MANISTKFDLNNFVYVITSFSKQYEIKCPACNGEGEITLPDGKNYRCPSCYARPVIKYDPEKWNISLNLSGHIGNIRIEIYDNRYDQEDEIRYMLSSTGVGSGTLWHEEDLFLTQEEAQEECNRRNRENGWITEAGQI